MGLQVRSIVRRELQHMLRSASRCCQDGGVLDDNNDKAKDEARAWLCRLCGYTGTIRLLLGSITHL